MRYISAFQISGSLPNNALFFINKTPNNTS